MLVLAAILLLSDGTLKPKRTMGFLALTFAASKQRVAPGNCPSLKSGRRLRFNKVE